MLLNVCLFNFLKAEMLAIKIILWMPEFRRGFKKSKVNVVLVLTILVKIHFGHKIKIHFNSEQKKKICLGKGKICLYIWKFFSARILLHFIILKFLLLYSNQQSLFKFWNSDCQFSDFQKYLWISWTCFIICSFFLFLLKNLDTF